MSTPPRRRLLVVTIALLMTGCGTTSPWMKASSATSGQVPSAATASEAPIGTGSPGASPGTSLAAGQTDTDWGRIWDSVPAGFPRFPGSTDADDASADPASARFSVAGGDPKAIATWMRGAFEEADLNTVGLNGPAEDGSFVVDSVGGGQCRVRTTIAPLGDTTFITVLYGADCPAQL